VTGILVGLAGGSEVRVGDGMVDLRPHRCSIPSPKPIKSSQKACTKSLFVSIGYLGFFKPGKLRARGGWGGGGVSPDKKNQKGFEKNRNCGVWRGCRRHECVVGGGRTSCRRQRVYRLAPRSGDF
jgi:hypothetical protein